MRNKFYQKTTTNVTPISEVAINTKSRHQLCKVLKGLQYLFITEALNKKIFSLLEHKIQGGKNRTGRYGMSLWEILVLGSVKLSLNIDYDFLCDLANNHFELQGILGVRSLDIKLRKKYKLQTIKDNVKLLDEKTIYEINKEVVKAGHTLIKKKGKRFV